MQRLFSTFPGGLPGLGLLLLRAALGVTVLFDGATALLEQFDLSVWTTFIGIAAIVCGALILLGFLTPIIGAFLSAGCLINTVFLFSVSVQPFFSPVIYRIILSAALILLGPGAFSVDAALFGRREIFIPKN